MTRTAISAVYKVFIIAVTVGIPLLLYFGSGGMAGLLAAILSFGVLASYALYADMLNRRG